MRFLVGAVLTIVLGAMPASANVLVGGIQYFDVEGRIGIRVSNAGKVDQVHPNSPAEQVGLRVGDTILTVDGKEHNTNNIHGIPGTRVSLTVSRHEKQFAVDVQRVDFREISNGLDRNTISSNSF